MKKIPLKNFFKKFEIWYFPSFSRNIPYSAIRKK